MELKFKRVVFKLSGEALAGSRQTGIDRNILESISKSIKKCSESGAQIGIVIGGGNFWRGRSSERMDRVRADHIGMLATAMNALAMADALENEGVEVRVQTALEIRAVAEPYTKNRAVKHLEKGRVVIFGCGTGNPFFSTDTAAALRAAEIGADAMLKATNTDGIYDCDPNDPKNKDPKKYEKISISQVISQNLKFMDAAASVICRENSIPVVVFGLDDPENIYKAITGNSVGTTVTTD